MQPVMQSEVGVHVESSVPIHTSAVIQSTSPFHLSSNGAAVFGNGTKESAGTQCLKRGQNHPVYSHNQEGLGTYLNMAGTSV